MPLIETADERAGGLATVKMVVLGKSGVGKTSLARSTDNVLVLDCEGGMLALEDSAVDSINITRKALELGRHPWSLLQDLVCILAGPSPNVTDQTAAYSQQHHTDALALLGPRVDIFGKYETIFVDSLTEISRFAFSYAKGLPGSRTDKGKVDTRGAYGSLGQEMVGADGLLNRLKHVKDRNIIVVAILDELNDENGRSYRPQVEGSKTANELPGIFDIVATLADLPHPASDETYKALVCTGGNQWAFPAKDRSGQLDTIEPPDLSEIISKVRGNRAREINRALPTGYDATPVDASPAASW